MDCPLESRRDLAEDYVAGTLPEAEQDAFEQHFFGCAACLARVQMLQEIKDGVRHVPPASASYRPPPPPARVAAPWLGLAVAAGLIAAVGWWWQGSPVPPGAPVAVATPPPGTPDASTAPAPAPGTPPVRDPIEAPTRQVQLAQLALVVPPRYVPLAVRGAAPAAGTFDAAMAHYVAGRHREAAAALRALSEARPTDPGIGFFWGISELALGRADGAREGLTRAIAADVQPYADEAHFYLAKVYLLEGAVDLARLELQYAVDHEAGPEGEAQRMLAALDRLPK
jgi:anti-sigma factor RsiW